MNPKSPTDGIHVVFKRGPAPNTVIAFTDPADIQDAMSQVRSDPNPAITEMLQQKATAA